MKSEILTKICKEDNDYARKKLLNILSNFGHLASCKKDLATFKQK